VVVVEETAQVDLLVDLTAPTEVLEEPFLG
jgi:hypothetical protein